MITPKVAVSADNYRLSVAIPLYNEELVIGELITRVSAVLNQLPGGPHEIVFVDDGSTDGTRKALQRAAKADPRIIAVLLSRNFGHQAALSAALDQVSGDVTVMMDGDLQDTPETIPKLLEFFWQGYDVVYAQRVARKEAAWLRISYRTFYRILFAMSAIHLPVDAGDFSLLSRRVVQELRRAPERHRYLRGLRAWTGFRQIGVPVERDVRAAGEPKYNLTRLFRLAADGIFSFTIAPLRAATLVGGATILVALSYGVFALYARLALHQSPQGFTTLILASIFMFGMLMMFLGVIGEYVGRIYEEVKRRPLYVVETVIRTTQNE